MKAALLMLTLMPLHLFADGDKISNEPKRFLDNVVAGNKSNNMTIIQTSTSDNPYANRKPEMYAKVIKQFGWFKGYGKPLTPEEARHHSLVYRFSNMNKAGNWTKMEALDAYGDLTTKHRMMPYLYNANDATDSGGNKDWADKLQSVCYWEFLADGTGKKCIMERANDEKGNLIYCYMPTYISDNEIIGQYIDAWGQPAAFRADSVMDGDNKIALKQHRLIHIIMDRQGNDSVLQHMDIYGKPCPNSNGVMMERRFYKNGIRVKELSCDILGNPVLDNWGNCGWVQELDARGNCIKYTIIDTEGKPMRMPVTDRNDDSEVGYITEYDRWDNQISQQYFDENLKPDTASNGVHRYVQRFDDRGNVIYKAAYDLDGNLHAFSPNTTAIEKAAFNKKGYRTLFEAFTVDGDYIDTSSGYFCRMETEYNDKNETTAYHNYVAIDKKLSLYKYYEKTANSEVYWVVNTKNCYKDSLDSKGRLVSRRYYNSVWEPVLSAESGYHQKLIAYSYDKRRNISTTMVQFFDEDGNAVVPSDKSEEEGLKKYASEVSIVDSLHHTTSVLRKNLTDVTESYRQKYNSDFSEILSQQSTNDFGLPARSRSNDGLLYYKGKVLKALDNNTQTIMGYNEFDEPALMTDDNKNIYCYYMDNEGKRTYYDEYMQPISDMSTFVNHTSEAFIIEVNDSIGYTNGLKDGDVLLRYGDWVTNRDASYNFEGELLLEEVLSAADDSIDVWLMRHHPERNTSEAVTLRLPGRTITELGFTHHRVYYTNTEKKRMTECFDNLLASNKALADEALRLRKQMNNWDRKIELVMPYQGNRSGHNRYYKNKRRNPMVFFAMHAIPDPNWVQKNPDALWTIHDDSDSIFNVINNRNTTDYFETVISENGKTVFRDSLGWSKNEGMQYFKVSLPQHREQVINSLLQSAERSYPQIMHHRDTRKPMWDLLTVNQEEDPHMDATALAGMFKHDYDGDRKFWRSEKNTTFIDNYKCNKKSSTNCVINELHSLEDELYTLLGSRIDSVRIIERFSRLAYEDTWLETMRRLDKNIYRLVGEKDSINFNNDSKIYFVRPAERGYSEIVRFDRYHMTTIYGHFPYYSTRHLMAYTLNKPLSSIKSNIMEDIDYSNPNTAYILASALYNSTEKDQEYAAQIMQKLADQKYERSYSKLAESYLTGTGVKQNKSKANKWMHKAIEKGHYGYSLRVFMNNLYDNKEYSDLKNLCQATLKSCNDSTYRGVANYYLGLTYEEGLGVKKDSVLAARHFIKAKEEGYADAYRHLPYGTLSKIMLKDMTEDDLYNEAQKRREDNPQLAHAYYLAAIDAGNIDAYYSLGEMYEDSTLTIYDKKSSDNYYIRSLEAYTVDAKINNVSSWYDVAYHYRHGKGVDKDTDKAIEAYLKGIDGGSKICVFWLADLYNKDDRYDEAFKYYSLGSEMGEKRCHFNVARYYEWGLGNITRNLKTAEEYYRKAEGYNEDYNNRIAKALKRLGVE